MKYIFIINPHAGPCDQTEDIKNKVKVAADTLADKGVICEYDFYSTSGKLDATEYVKGYLENKDEDVCFVACGGDGTVGEVAAGCIGHDNAYMSVYPCGSGNDYVKYYGGKKPFLDITGIFEGSFRDVDVMRVGDRYSINVCNFGFDTSVVETMEKVKRKPIIGGNNSYYTGIISSLFTALKNKCKVYADGELLNPDGNMLLCSLANGSYYGGSFNCAPKSDNTDGLMEVCLVSPVSVPRFVSLVSYYEKGTHLDNVKFEKILKYRRAKSVRIEAPEGFIVSLDGELAPINEVTIENMQKCIHFIVPRDSMITPAKLPSLVK